MSLGVGEQHDDGRAADRRATVKMRALAHPIRLRVLSLLTGTAMTAAEVARELHLTHANASYHLRQLLAAGTIKVVGEERIRGGLARRYRYDVDRDFKQPSPSTGPESIRRRQQVYAAVAQELRRRGSRVRPGQGRGHVTDAELWVEPEVWSKMKSTVDEISETLHRAARPARTEGTILVNATFVMFEMDPLHDPSV